MLKVPSDALRIADYVKRQADNCLEVSRRTPCDYLLDNTPREMWLTISGVLSAVAEEIESGRYSDLPGA
ncbi:hypothetical protein [Parafrankia sp. BMG5.11]|uniref:hypothetical protein n=1 Tax=Parafrankia sp. BMG5.11 TaxID=222540 RepID=UPI0010405D06|nr:hypothetical protein [Parafrankia sp. BMG5.11]TCJ30967.1 hypothetical protein E0504_49540 [Parafrankia sp. BMG5.11]